MHLNDTRREKLCFTQFRARMAAWLLLTFFIYLHNQLSQRCQRVHILKNVIHQRDRKNEWLLLSASFTTKCMLVFVLMLFLRGLILNTTERA